MDNKPIVLVDDDHDDTYLLKDAFQESGIEKQVIIFNNSQEFIIYLDSLDEVNFPAIIFLDLNMPILGGTELLKKIKTSDKLRGIPVIVLSGSASEKDKRNAYASGANCYVKKLVKYTEVLDLVKSITLLYT